VIFDPVAGMNPFLQTEDARRLVNVALSRAKARLILFLSAHDLENPIFKQIDNVIQSLPGLLQVSDGARPTRPQRDRNIELILHPQFPRNVLNKELTICTKNRVFVGQVKEVSPSGDHFDFYEYDSGEMKKFKTAFVKKSAFELKQDLEGKTRDKKPEKKVDDKPHEIPKEVQGISVAQARAELLQLRERIWRETKTGPSNDGLLRKKLMELFLLLLPHDEREALEGELGQHLKRVRESHLPYLTDVCAITREVVP
jgi:hypothetical protein